MEFLWFALIGIAAGWIGGQLMRGGGFGLLGNLIVGLVGAMLGGWVMSLLNISAGGGMVGSLITAVIGAVVLLFVVGLVRKK